MVILLVVVGMGDLKARGIPFPWPIIVDFPRPGNCSREGFEGGSEEDRT